MKRTLTLILFLSLFATVSAQDGATLHFMRMNPYSTNYNPSTFIPYRYYVGMIGIGNVNVAASNTGFHYNTLFGKNAGSPITTIYLNDFVNHLARKGNTLNTSVALSLVDFGFTTKKIRFAFSYKVRFDENFLYNQDLFAFPVYGNMHFAGEENAAHPDLYVGLNAYHEIGLGMQTELTPRLYLGVKPKLLFGLANVRVKDASATIITDPDDYSMSLSYNLDASAMCSIPYSVDSAFNGEFNPGSFKAADAFKNVGAALDLGLTYRINDQFGIAASLLDLGFIRWKTNGNRFQSALQDAGTYYNDGSFLFSGLSTEDVERIINDPESFKEELLTYFPLHHEGVDHYTTALNGRFMVEGYANVGQCHRFSALFQGRLIHKHFLPSFTVAWNGNFWNVLDVCAAYTMAKKSYANIGLGLGVNMAVVQLYIATDNILSFINSKSIQRSLLNTPNANVQLGLVFNWGKLQEKELRARQAAKN